MNLTSSFICALPCILTLTALVHAQNQSGFISIDCGILKPSRYTDEITGLDYVSDADLTDTGEIHSISSEYKTNKLEQQFLNLRSFPEGRKNCYTIKFNGSSDKFLIRARFMYGNYDGQNNTPSFRLMLETDVWDSVYFKDASSIITKEIIHNPRRNYIHVCLANAGSGTPFISALELRPLQNSLYQALSGSLILTERLDVGATTNDTVRYKDDVFDRIWSPYSRSGWTRLSTSLSVDTSMYKPPSSVMQTAASPADNPKYLNITWRPTDPTRRYYFYFHFAEIELKGFNQTRVMTIYDANELLLDGVAPRYLSTSTYFSGITFFLTPIRGKTIELSIEKAESSTLPPILNALEIYEAIELSELLTSQQDVDAIMNIKSRYRVKKDWQGDPCAPKDERWQGLNCSYYYQLPRITSLNLSSSGISGEIVSDIASLTSIESLDLSNNSLMGPVPEFLAELQFLRVLNLSDNNLQGSLPSGLIEKEKNGSLLLSVDGNPNMCLLPSCKGKNNKFIVPVLASIVSFSVLIAALAILWNLRRRKQEGKWWLLLTVIGVALLIPILFYLCYLVLRKLRAKVDRIKNRKKLLRELNTYGKGLTQEKDQSTRRELKIFDFQTIVAATNNFSPTNELGKGGFGQVYKGKLLDGQEIAIKRLSQNSGQGVEEFKNEAKLIAKLQHTNLVRLLGCSLQGEERILVYEYMPNKSLDFFIFDSDRKNVLNWKKHFIIIEGIAQGLLYLHKYSRLKVIHRDLKASNILLDDQMNPKISDFGLAKIFGVNESEANTNRIVGTYGYMSPEYAMNGVVSIKTDVFSFGVLVLEIVSGKKNNSSYRSEHPLNLVGYAWQLMNEGKGLELKDTSLDESCSPGEVLRCIHVGLLCVQDQANDRPTMSDVVSMLTNEAMNLPAPKQPAFYINDSNEEPQVSGNRLDNCSANDVTITAMFAR